MKRIFRNALRVTFIAALLAICPVVNAQTFKVSPAVISGGGGTSSGGNFSVTGTIGQHGTDSLAGGNFALQGGFWSSAVAIQTAGVPHLSIVRSGNNYILSWPDTGATFVIEVTSTLQTTATAWGNSGASPTLSNGTNTVTLPVQAGRFFYRLRFP